MTVLPDDYTLAADLALLSEHPAFRLMRLRYDTISEAERNAKTVLRLLAVLEYPEDEDPYPLLEILDCADSGITSGTDYSLKVIGAWRTRRLLALCLSRPSSDDDAALRNWFDSHERAMHRLLWRLTTDGVVELQTKLWRYLRQHQSEVRAWNVPAMTPQSESVANVGKEGPPPEVDPCAASGTPYTVHLFEQNEHFDRMMDEWLRVAGTSCRYGAGKPKRLERYTSNGPTLQSARCGDRLDGTTIGNAHDENLAINPGIAAFQRDLDGTLRELVNRYGWAVTAYPNTMQQSAAIWISSNPRHIADIDRLAQSCRSRIATYNNITSLESCARGAQFAECKPYGEAALAAADVEGVPPWVVITVDQHSGHWWRSATAGLETPVILGGRARHGQLRIAYRATDRKSYLDLWRNFDRHTNVAAMAISGTVKESRISGAIGAARGYVTFQSIDDLADRCGWVYCHCHGGGLGEHHAMFSARDSSITRHVEKFVRDREGQGYWRTGRW